ncbi:MAG TPA: SDR family oxidoreductase [Acidimicrobiales bacterium]|nr:SDR family oxidoreductase [Acidimicrobiales bacterium]
MADKTVLTTGANSGIGLATVLKLAEKGFRSVGSVRSEAKAETVERAAKDAGVDVETVILDVTDAERCEKVVADLELHALVNNAGYGMVGAVEDVDDDEARQLIETMVIAPMRLTRLALPALRANKGRIVNVSSIAGRTTAPFAGWYTAAKHALEALSDSLRMEVGGDGVHVVLIEPGGFKTGIWEEFERDIERRAESGSRYVDAYRRSLSGQRLAENLMGTPETCARVIAMALTSPVPLPRYLVGVDAWALNLADTLTPTMLKDRLVRLGLGL